MALLASKPTILGAAETDYLDLGAREAAYVVIPNQNGQLVPTAAYRLTPPGEARALAVGAFDVGQRQLLVATTDGVYRFDGGTQFSAIYTDSEPDERFSALRRVRALAMADVTGDGVTDLVLGMHDSVTVLRALTENP